MPFGHVFIKKKCYFLWNDPHRFLKKLMGFLQSLEIIILGLKKLQWTQQILNKTIMGFYSLLVFLENVSSTKFYAFFNFAKIPLISLKICRDRSKESNNIFFWKHDKKGNLCEIKYYQINKRNLSLTHSKKFEFFVKKLIYLLSRTPLYVCMYKICYKIRIDMQKNTKHWDFTV